MEHLEHKEHVCPVFRQIFKRTERQLIGNQQAIPISAQWPRSGTARYSPRPLAPPCTCGDHMPLIYNLLASHCASRHTIKAGS